VPLLYPDQYYWTIEPEESPDNWWEYFPPAIDSGSVVIQIRDPESS
jgi:hypothetical protein